MWGLPQRQASQEHSSVSPVTTQFINVGNAVVAVVPYRSCSLQDQDDRGFPGVLTEEDLLQNKQGNQMEYLCGGAGVQLCSFCEN